MYIRVEFDMEISAGDLQDMLDLADRLDVPVVSTIEGMELFVYPGVHMGEIISDYNNLCRRQVSKLSRIY